MKTAVASLAVVLCLLVPGAAMAGTASLDLAQSDLGPGIMLENLNYRAAPGEANRLAVSFDGSSTYTLTDSVGITAGRNCTHPNSSDATRVTCVRTSGQRLGGVLVKLGDKNDRASLSGRGGVVLGGGGSDVLRGSELTDVLSAGSSETKIAKARTRDRLYGNGGSDFLRGSRGPNRMSGGLGLDVISAGPGNDRINARDSRVDQVRCGGGRDRAKLDTADFLADRCRFAPRGIPAATPIDLFTSGLNAFVDVGCPRDVKVQRCVGTVRISQGRRTFGKKRFNLAPGRKVAKGIRLPEDIRRAIGPNGGPLVRVTVRSRSGRRLHTTFFTRVTLPPPGD